MTLTTIRSEVLRLLGGLTTTEFSNNDIDQSVSSHYHKLSIDAIQASGEWQVSGEVATANIVQGQQEYVFPSDLIQLHRIEANFTNGTDTWETLGIIDMRSEPRSLSNTSTQTTPRNYVRVFDESIFLMDAPSTAVTAGLKIYFSDEPAELTTVTEPIFPEAYHIALVYGAMFDYALSKKLFDEQKQYKTLLDEKTEEIKRHYASRLPAKRARLRTRNESYA